MSSLSLSPVPRKIRTTTRQVGTAPRQRPTESKSPKPSKSPSPTDGRRTKEPLPEQILFNAQYFYVNALCSDPPLADTIGPFLEKYSDLCPDKETKRRLGKLPGDWDRSGPYIAPPAYKAQEAAEYIQTLKHQKWAESNHRRMSEHNSAESDYESIASEEPKITPKAKATKSSNSRQNSSHFKPAPATFTINPDPPTTKKKSYGFSIDELGIGNLQGHSKPLNQIVFVNPEEPETLPKGFVVWDDEVLVEEMGVKLWIQKVGVLAILDSPESAVIVASTDAKLEKDGRGFSFGVPLQDPNFIKSLDDIKKIVVKKSFKTLGDADGMLFANKVSPTNVHDIS